MKYWEIIADDIQQLTLVIIRKFLGETRPKGVHETFEAGGHLRIVLDVVGPQQPRRRTYIASDQHGSIKIADQTFIALGQLAISPDWVRKNDQCSCAS
jgi:hypothetical protein